MHRNLSGAVWNLTSTCTWPLGYKLLGHAQCIQVHLRQPNNKYPFTSTFRLNRSRQEATNRTPPLALDRKPAGEEVLQPQAV